jgi:hypothetical protein
MTHPRERYKAEVERSVFREFVTRLNDSAAWLGIESRPPPEPDLLCRHATRGAVAFELVAITDPNIAKVDASSGLYAFSTSDPTDRIIRKKLGRIYSSAVPIEPLIYNDLLVITPDDGIIETCRNWLGSKTHQFTKACYMGESTVRCIWEQ